MEKLPNELAETIFDYLPFRDCVRLASTCSRFSKHLPKVLSRFRVTELVIHNVDDCIPVAFLERYLASNLVKIRVSLDTFDEPFAEKVRLILMACPGIKEVVMESSLHTSAAHDGLGEFYTQMYMKQRRHRDSTFSITRGYILPNEVERCLISDRSLHSSALYHRTMVNHFGEAVPTVRSANLKLTFSNPGSVPSVVSTLFAPKSMWPNLSGLVMMKELSITAPCNQPLEAFDNQWVYFNGVTTLKLALPLTLKGLQTVLERFPNLEVLYLNPRQFRTGTFDQAVSWPASLKQLHLEGQPPKDNDADLWSSLFDSCKSHASLEVITQGYNFARSRYGQEVVPRCVAPRLKQDFVQSLSEYREGLFKSWVFVVQDQEEWEGVEEFLSRSTPLDHVYLYIDVGNDEKKTGDDYIEIESHNQDKIHTKVARLSVNNNKMPLDPSAFNLASAFVNVAEYSIHSQLDIPFLRQYGAYDRLRGKTINLYIGNVGRGPEKFKAMSKFSGITRLYLSHCVAEFSSLKEAMGPTLKHFQVEAGYHFSDACVYRSAASYCIVPKQLEECLQFAKLEEVVYTNLCPMTAPDLRKLAESMAHVSEWPSQLRQISFLFMVHGESVGIRLKNLGYKIQVLASDYLERLFS